MSTAWLWLGGLTSTSVRATCKLNLHSSSAVLACRDAAGNWVRSSPVATVGNIAKLEVTGLIANTAYTCRVEPGDAQSSGVEGMFTTLPSGTNVSFTVALCGDAVEASNATVFDAIRTSGARFGIHLGDKHYRNIPARASDEAEYRSAIEEIFAQSRQAALYRAFSWVDIWDDHDAGPNNSDSTTSPAAARAIYRAMYPHHDLAVGTANAPIYHSFAVGRVRFIVTDQRSASSIRSATDNSSKTILGAAQKTWFKAEVSAAAAAGQMIVWVCSRHWCGDTTAGADHWGGFNTERTELVDYIKANAHGRCIILSADMHAMMIRTDKDFATGGGEAIPCFNVATLDHGTIDTAGYGGVGSTGATRWEATNGIFATMQVVDSGGSTISVTWRGFNTAGNPVFTAYTFSVAV
jgi:phosphodiesterase/alkaline phosphatase D-like protein